MHTYINDTSMLIFRNSHTEFSPSDKGCDR